MRRHFAALLAAFLLLGRRGKAKGGQRAFVCHRHQRQSEGRSAFGRDLRIQLGHHAVGRAGERAEGPVDALFHDLLFGRSRTSVRPSFSAITAGGSGSPWVRGGYMRSAAVFAAVAIRPPIRPASAPFSRFWVGRGSGFTVFAITSSGTLLQPVRDGSAWRRQMNRFARWRI